MGTPILFIVYNRLQTVEAVLESIRAARPQRLYIAADGPKGNPEDAGKCAGVRVLIDKGIDWDCEIRKLYNQKNLGCQLGVQSAIDWFFSHETEGIVLEDDCLPSASFFPYCEELLARYRDDERIMTIAGFSAVRDGEIDIPESYTFVKFPITWGWATWRRAWRLYDGHMATWPEFNARRLLGSVFRARRSIRYWQEIFDWASGECNLSTCNTSTWDYQWSYASFVNSGLCALPKRSLVRNIGFGDDATHTKQTNTFRKTVDCVEINFPIVHPKFVLCDEDANSLTERRWFRKQSFLKRARRRISSLFFAG